MDIHELIQQWERRGVPQLSAKSFSIQLPLREAARLAALEEMFPFKRREELIAELLATALDQIEAALPYVQGERVIAEDEDGNPIFEDVGLTPQFLHLTRKHEEQLRAAPEA